MNKRILAILLNVSVICFFIALCAFAYRGLFIRLLADDYCFGAYTKEKGLWGAQIHWFTQFNGRFTFNLLSSLFHNYVRFTPFITLVIWGTIMFWSLKQIFFLIGLRLTNMLLLLLTEVILYVHLDSTLSIMQSFFWQTGRAAYTIPLIFFTLYLGLLCKYIKQIQQTKTVYLYQSASLFIITFLAAGFSEVYTLSQLFIFSFALIIAYIKRNKNKELARSILLLLMSSFFGSVCGVIIMSVAPGNIGRQLQHKPPPNLITPGILGMTYSFYYILLLILNIYKYAVTIFYAAFMTIIACSYKNTFHKVKETMKKYTKIVFLTLYSVILLTVSIPLFAIFSYPGARSFAIPNFFVVLVSLYVGILIGLYIQDRIKYLRYKKELLTSFMLLLLILGPVKRTLLIINERSSFQHYARAWDLQEKKLQEFDNKKINVVVVKALGFTYGLEDVQKNSKHWVNDCISRYYNLPSVKTE